MPRSGTGPRSAGSSSPGWAANSARTRWPPSPTSRTSSSQPRSEHLMQRLQDRVAVITGAGSGIGLASARRLAAERAVIVAVDIDEAAGKAAAAQTGGTFVAADVASEPAVRQLYESVVERHGRIDIAFNNAGISPPEDDSILTTGIEAWRRVQEINLDRKSTRLNSSHDQISY